MKKWIYFSFDGDKDTVVPVSASEKYIEIYGESSKLKIISGANHTFDKKE